MPSAELVAVADAITTELTAAQQAGQFVDLAAFTPERSYADWANDLAELSGLRVDVVGVAYTEAELADRGSVAYVCTSHVGVRHWFLRSETEGTDSRIKRASIDRLVLFIQELNEFFCKEGGRRLAAYPAASWQDTKILTTYSRKHLRDHRMFLGILRVSYYVTKTL